MLSRCVELHQCVWRVFYPVNSCWSWMVCSCAPVLLRWWMGFRSSSESHRTTTTRRRWRMSSRYYYTARFQERLLQINAFNWIRYKIFRFLKSLIIWDVTSSCSLFKGLMRVKVSGVRSWRQDVLAVWERAKEGSIQKWAWRYNSLLYIRAPDMKIRWIYCNCTKIDIAFQL